MRYIQHSLYRTERFRQQPARGNRREDRLFGVRAWISGIEREPAAFVRRKFGSTSSGAGRNCSTCITGSRRFPPSNRGGEHCSAYITGSRGNPSSSGAENKAALPATDAVDALEDLLGSAIMPEPWPPTSLFLNAPQATGRDPASWRKRSPSRCQKRLSNFAIVRSRWIPPR